MQAGSPATVGGLLAVLRTVPDADRALHGCFNTHGIVPPLPKLTMKTQASNANSIPSLTHVTLTTGHTAYTSRSEVPESHIKQMADLIQSASVERIPGADANWLQLKIPFDKSYTAMLSMDGTNLLTTLMHRACGPVLTFGTALRSDEGTKLWDLLGGAGDQPPVPWCAVQFEPGMFLVTLSCPEDLGWFGSFERDLAWGWHALAASTSREVSSDTVPENDESAVPSDGGSEVGISRDFFSVENNGPELLRTDYWTTSHAQKGLCYLSGNAGVLRLLVPSAQDANLAEMKTATRVTIERSMLDPDRAFDIVFEDGTPSPFFLSLDFQQKDRKLTPGRTRLVVYSESHGKVLDLACRVDRSAQPETPNRRHA